MSNHEFSVFAEFRSLCYELEKTEPDKRKRIDNLLKYVERIYLQINRLDVNTLGSLGEASNILTVSFNNIDSIWLECKFYPSKRMKYLIDCVAADLTKFIISVLESFKLFDINKANRSLQICCKLAKQWLNSAHTATINQWTRDVRKWDLDPYSNDQLNNLIHRLEFLVELRRSYFICSQYANGSSTPSFDNISDCLKSDESSFESIKQNLMGILNSLLSNNGVTENIIDVLRKLRDNQDALADQLLEINFLKNFDSFSSHIKEFERQRDELFKNYLDLTVGQISLHKSDDPTDIGGLVWLYHQITYARNFVKRSGGLNSSIEDVYNRALSEYQKATSEIAKNWVVNLLKKFESIDFTQPLFTFDFNSTNKLISLMFPVEYDDILNQSNQLIAIGLSIPQNLNELIRRLRDHKMMFCSIKQVCDFFNTTILSLVRPLRRLFVPFIDNFASTFNQISSVDFSQASSVEEYRNSILQSASSLYSNYTPVYEIHKKFIADISVLFETSLITGEKVWTETTKNIRNQIGEIYRSGKTNIKPWMKHLNAQLFKALDYQFERTLITMEKDVQKITIDVDYVKPNLVFEPTLSNLRTKLYSQISHLISIPSQFTGISHSTQGQQTSDFASIVSFHLEAIENLYVRTEKLIQQVAAASEKLQPWIILGNVPSFDAEIGQLLVTPDDFRVNFNTIVLRESEIKQIPDTMEFDFITLNFVNVKGAFERLTAEFKRSIYSLLSKSCDDDISAVRAFINTSLDSVQSSISTSDEVKQVKETLIQINSKKGEINSKLFEAIRAKTSLLMIFEPENRQRIQFQIYSLDSDWKVFDGTLKDHINIVNKQMNTLRSLMSQKLDDFQRRTASFKNRWEERKPKNVDLKNSETVKKVIQVVKGTKEQLDEFLKEKEQLDLENESYGVKSQRQFRELEDISNELRQYEDTWLLVDKWQTSLDEISEEEWESYRTHFYDFEDFLKGWEENCRRVQSNISDYILDQVRYLLNSFYYPCIKHIRGENWVTEHWEELGIIIKFHKPLKISELKLGDIVQYAEAIRQNINQIKILSEKAKGEGTIRSALREIREWNMHTEFVLMEQNGVPLIKEWKDLLTQVSDMQAMIQSLSSLQFADSFESQIQDFTNRFATLHEALLLLNQIQRKWIHLAPIFSSGALPSHTDKFNSLDNQFKTLMNETKKDPQVTSLLNKIDIVATLKGLLDGLEQCQSALTAFLESKRQGFPRLYFIGDFDLLEILGKVREDPSIVQTHLKNLFQGIVSVKFDEENKLIAYSSSLGETIYLPEPIYTTNSVEIWLYELCQKAQSALEQLLIDYMKSGKFTTKNFPSQIVQVGEGIKYCAQMNKAIPSGGIHSVLSSYTEMLHRLADYHTKPLNDPGVTSKVKLDTTESSEVSLIKSLIMDLVQYTSAMQDLEKSKVTQIDNFEWMRRFKYFFENNKCIIRMCDGTFEYGYEYQGNAPKLVHTPLTDLCWSTLCEGMHLGFAGNPYGPAGTGKTESVKALGQAMGRQVLVFNCGDGIDVKSICRIFTGLVQCGAWGCFDEFNRLDELVLSAVSQQIQAIQTAILKKRENVTLLSKTVPLDLKSGIFVTLNPAGKGYGGRSKLPNNLKALFRSVSMAQPDKVLIGEVMLYSEGFTDSRKLAQRLTTVFSLASQLLSKQKHYDWGLRAQKTVLNMAGQWLRQSDDKSVSEEQVIIRALLFDTLGKLDSKDRKLFLDIVKDVFKTDQTSTSSENDIQQFIDEVITEKKLQKSQAQLTKISLLYQLIQHRTGAVIVGPTGCGKSTVWKVLSEALTKSGRTCHVWHIVPKSDSLEMLMGSIDLDTREWTDGSLTKASRAAARLPPDEIGFIVCDGDVDPVWIESLNSVLDDNRLLTLPTGERIQFDSNVKFIFETHSLQFASPATVSRMGVLFVNRSDFDVKLTFQRLTEGMTNEMIELFNKLVPQSIELLHKARSSFVFQVSDLSIVRNIIHHVKTAGHELEFVLGLIRGCCGLLSTNIHNKCAEHILKIAKGAGIRVDQISNSPLISYWSAADKTVKSFTNEKLSDGSWNSRHPPFVSTPDSMQYYSYAESYVKASEPLLLVGPKGCGKTTMIRKLYPGDVEVINCNSLTNAKQVIRRISDLCSSSPSANGVRMKPRSGKHLAIYFRGLHYPSADKYETVELHSFIIQLTQLNGYVNESLEWVELTNINIVASIDPAESLQPISERLISQFRIVSMDSISTNSLVFVYCEYISAILKSLNKTEWNQQLCSELAKSTVAVYDQFLSKNGFTAKDLTKWITSITRYFDNSPNECLLYEACRLFSDRLFGSKRKEFESVLGKSFTGKPGIYSSFGQSDNLLHQMSGGEVKKQLASAVVSYEREIGPLDISLQSTMLKLATQINRAIALPGGHLMLVANTGTGVKSVLRLAVHAMKGKVFTPSIFDGYSLRHFSLDLKAAIGSAAFDKNISVFCLDEYHLVSPLFFDYINSILAGVFPSGLYTSEEIKTILSQLEDISFEQYKKLIFNNLRLVFIIDPRSPSYITLIKSQPLIQESCTILNIGEFPEQVLNEMVPHLVTKLEAPEEISKLPFAKIAKTLGVPTSSFQTLIKVYINLSKKKSQSLANRKKFLNDGLLRLNAVSEKVNQLSKEADAQRAQVQEKEARAKEAMNDISKTMTELTSQQDQMEVIQKELHVKEKELQAQKSEIDAQLADILPVLQKASENVGKIGGAEISELKTMSMPPPAVRDVLQGVILLLGERDTSWQAIRRFLAQPSVREKILNFDPHNATQKSIEEVQKTLQQRPMSFDYETVQKSSSAAAPLAQWVKAMASYCVVLRDVQPLEVKMKKCDDDLKSSKQELAALEEKKAVLNDRVSQMQVQFQEFTAEAEKLRISLNEIEEKQNAAASLLAKLKDEQERWEKQVKEIEEEHNTIQPRLLAAAAFIVQAGELNETERISMMKNVCTLLELNDGFNFTPFMNSQSELLEIKHEGFPSDDLSVENAQIILNNEERTLFIIDPTEKVVSWLQNVLGPSAETLSISHPRFQHQLTLAIRFGKKLIIREADKIPLALYPYLSNEFIRESDRLTVSVGDKFINVHPEFRLLIVTRNSSIKLTPRELGLVSLVNFTVTKTALKAQLLTLALSTENPELEQQHQEQLSESENLKLELGKLEEGLLDILAKADPNTILSNKELIKSLDEKKKRAVDVEQRLSQVEKFQEEIQQKRLQYQMLADISSSIFFTIDTLHLVQSMYRFSLNEFTSLFIKCFSRCNDTQSRVKSLVMTFNSMAYSHFSRALFREHRLIFGLALLKTVYPKMFPEKEYMHLLRPKPVDSIDTPRWVPSERANSYSSLVSEFPELCEKLKFSEAESEWQKWIEKPTPEASSAWPQLEDFKISQLQRVLVLQALRPDRVISALEKLVINSFKNPKVLSLRDLMTSENESTFVFIVTPGSDPSIELKEIALELETVGEENYIELALGECDSSEALSLVKQAARSGQWAVIKNVHLDIDFLQQLERLLPSLGPKENFKLILTTEATPLFPAVLLQSSSKVAYEAPPGLVNQIKRTLTLWNEDWFKSNSQKVKQSLTSLAHLHGVLQERRAYLPIGWSQFFEFTQADLNAAAEIIAQRCDSIDVVRGLLETTVYGSRMDSSFDRRVLRCFIYNSFPVRKIPLFDIPEDLSLSSLQKVLTQVSIEDGPSVLSLCPNANATIARSTLISSFRYLSILSSASESKEETSSSYSQRVKQLLQQFKSVNEDVKVTLQNHPALDFLHVQKFTNHKTIRMVVNDVESLSNAADSSLLPARLRAVDSSLKDNVVPGEWLCDWIDNESVEEFIDELFMKTAALDSLTSRLQDHNILTSQPIPLSSTVRPSAFISALLQSAARNNGSEIDQMKVAATFHSPVSDSYLTINVCDISAQAAIVSNGIFDISTTPNNDLSRLEKVYLNICSLKSKVGSNSIKIPLFEGLTREKLICEVEVPCNDNTEEIILASCALVLS